MASSQLFRRYPILALGDIHGMAQEEDFFAQVIRDPRFAKDIGNVVVEFGDASQQDTIDRFVASDDVSYEQLRRVWTDTAGWMPTVTSMGYLNFFATARAVNLSLPAAQQLHVWLGDPPVDWSKVTKRDDLPNVTNRNQFPADLITSKLLSQGKRALVIYGVGHLSGQKSLVALIEKSYPSSVFVVTPYFGFVQKSCSEAFEAKLHGWPIPALATPRAQQFPSKRPPEHRLSFCGCIQFLLRQDRDRGSESCCDRKNRRPGFWYFRRRPAVPRACGFSHAIPVIS